jgi:uncharacterized lipoprotein YmbA
MKTIHVFWYPLALLLLGLGLMSGWGCVRSSPAKFYNLSPLPPSAESKVAAERVREGLVVGIGPIRFPKYLSSKEIVTRKGPNELDVAEFHLWGGSLQDDFTRTLLENVSHLLAADRVSLSLWPGTATFDYRLLVDVSRFDGIRGGDVILIANWTILQGKDFRVVQSGSSRIEVPTGGESYEAIVRAMSLALGSLSQELAKDIKACLYTGCKKG